MRLQTAFLALVALVSAGITYGERALSLFTATSKSPPDLHFDSLFANAGTVVQGAVYRHRFAFRNLGGGDLVLGALRSDCHCIATLLLSGGTIRPSEVGAVEVQFDSASELPGTFLKNIDVNSNDPSRPTIRLTLAGKVAPEFTFSQSKFDFERTKVGTRLRLAISILVKSSAATITSVSTTQAGVSTTLRRLSDAETGRSFEVTAELYSDQPRILMGNIIVHTTSKYLPEVRIPVRGWVS